MTKTLDDYGNALKLRYNEIKNDDASGLLLHPSPANLKILCSLKAEKNISADDRSIFEFFFDWKADENLLKKITVFDIDKLRPVGHFLKGKTKTTGKPILELIAILVDYELRPFGRFTRSETVSKSNDRQTELELALENHDSTIKQDNKPENLPFVLLISDQAKALQREAFPKMGRDKDIVVPKKIRQPLISIAIALIFFVGLSYVARKELFPAKDCLEWKIDHYETVVCNGSAIDSLYKPRLVQRTEELLRLRRLKVSKETPFFINGKPAVWYSKNNNVVEFFNAPGVHPISMESLKPVTRHIVERYGRVN